MEGGQGQHIAFPEEFKLDQAELTKIWAQYTEENDEKYFRKYVRSFVKSWEEQVSPNWELLVISTVDGMSSIDRPCVQSAQIHLGTTLMSFSGRRVEGPSLSDLPDELLPALSKFLFVGKDEAEQGTIELSSVQDMTQIVKCLVAVCRKIDNIPLIGSMAFVAQLTQTVTLLLQVKGQRVLYHFRLIIYFFKSSIAFAANGVFLFLPTC